MPKRSLPPLLITALAVLGSIPAYGLGFRIPDQSATAVGRGNAFAATADDPSAVYYNPAGITQLAGSHALLNGYGIAFQARVNLEAPGSKDFDNKWDPQAVPQSFSTYQLFGSPVWFGFGVYVPFGLKNRYSDDVPFRNVAREGSIEYVTYNPVLAWKVTERFSIAAGLTINHAKASLVQGIVSKGDEFRFEGSDTSFGFNAGLLWQPHPMHSFGATYVSQSTMDLRGETLTHFEDQHRIVPVAPGVFAPITIQGVDGNRHASARIQFPQHITLGYSLRPTKDWNVEFDLDWTDWETLNDVTLKQRHVEDKKIPFNYNASFLYEVGVTRKFGLWHVSAGYIYSQRTVPNEEFNPAVPDTDRHVFSVGFGRKYDKMSWDLAYQYLWGPERNIDRGTVVDGNYRFEAHAVSLAVGYHF
jgi:long-chain fatty acid transport protein